MYIYICIYIYRERERKREIVQFDMILEGFLQWGTPKSWVSMLKWVYPLSKKPSYGFVQASGATTPIPIIIVQSFGEDHSITRSLAPPWKQSVAQ